MTEPVAPEIDPDESNYAHCQVVDYLPIPAETFFDWYMNEPVENFMHGTPIVSPVTGCEAVPGHTYGEPRAPRIIHFKDGTLAWERILKSDFPHKYFYQPYAFTNPVCLISDHAKATMAALPHEGGTKIVWDYAFHARNRFGLPLLKLFVWLDWKRNMRNGLKVIRTHMEKYGTTCQIHQGDTSQKAIRAHLRS